MLGLQGGVITRAILFRPTHCYDESFKLSGRGSSLEFLVRASCSCFSFTKTSAFHDICKLGWVFSNIANQMILNVLVLYGICPVWEMSCLAEICKFSCVFRL